VDEATYANETGTHTIRVVKPKVLSGTEADDLDLTLLLVPPSYVEPAATPSGTSSRRVDPALQAALAGPRWRRSGTVGDFLVFTNTRARGRAWLRPVSASPGGAPGGTVSVRHVGAQDDETDVVQSRLPVRLVRSVAYADGWTAELRTAGGAVRSVPARRLGLVQSVMVPAGVTIVSWTYHAPGLRVGLVLTLLAIAFLVAVGLVLGARHVRRRIARQRREATQLPAESSSESRISRSSASLFAPAAPAGPRILRRALRHSK
jgi:hypothetical protein